MIIVQGLHSQKYGDTWVFAQVLWYKANQELHLLARCMLLRLSGALDNLVRYATRPKLTALSANSGKTKSELVTRTAGTISLFVINGVRRSIVAPSERTQTASIAESTAFGGEERR